MCSIAYTLKGRLHASEFAARVPVDADLHDTTRLQVEASIQGDLISATSADLQRMAKLEKRASDAADGEQRANRHQLKEGKKR